MRIDYSKFIVEEILTNTLVRNAIVSRYLDDDDIDDSEFSSTESIVKLIDTDERVYDNWNVHDSDILDNEESKCIVEDISNDENEYSDNPRWIYDKISLHYIMNLNREFVVRRFVSRGGFTEAEMRIEIVSSEYEDKVIAWIVTFD